jgi:hypothetical protein
MPTIRGNLHISEYPDTKIPRAIFPDIDDGYKIDSAIHLLNLGDHEAFRHYAAIVPIHKLDKYALFYRTPGSTWSSRNMRILKSTLEDSLYMLDNNKKLHRLIERTTGLKRKRKRRNKTVRKRKQKNRTISKKRNKRR